MRWAIVWCAALLPACGNSFTPASLVQGLRVLAVKAEPPEVAPGQTTTLTALAVDTTGAAVQASWSACTEPALAGTGPINPDCFTHDSAPYLTPLGAGLSITAVVPQVAPADFGPPDASGGVYLPILARTSSTSGTVDAAYQLRLAQGAPPNHNPTLTGVFAVQPDGTLVALVEATSLVVHAGDQVTLQAQFSADSQETYQIVLPGLSETVAEQLRVSWFATGGSFSEPVTGLAKPNTVWRADSYLPAAGTAIDVYVVGRDERGGTDWLHRLLVLQ
jgi:hypothetical protein